MSVAVATIRPLVDAWIAKHDTAEEAYRVLATSTGLASDTWRKRLSDLVVPSPRGTWRGWWSFTELDDADADELLVAMGSPELWHEALGEATVGLKCEDCHRHIDEATGYRPLDLMRPDPSAQEGIVWDSTKRKIVVRPGAARAGGRRFRKVDLCRRCAGEALRRRAMVGATNGRGKHLRTKDRVPPRRGGRPRLLDERQLRELHAIYVRELVSIGDLATALAIGGKVKGTRSGFYQSMLYGWRNLGLELRPRNVAIKLGHHRRGRKPAASRQCPATTSRGKPCRLFAKAGSDYCVSHDPAGAADRREHLDRIRSLAA